MAPPAADHQAGQEALAAALIRQLVQAWNAILDTAHLKRSLPELSAAVAALVHRYGMASAAVAADYYDAARADAGVRGAFTVIPAQPAPPEQVDAGVSWATRNLWRPDPDEQAARTMTEGVAQRLALDAGRNTILGAVRDDRKAIGWAREPQPGCCAFCAMLATRGSAYVSRKTAAFQAHDHDRCLPVPVFTAYEPPAHVREWQALWRDSTRGYSGKGAIKAFRQAYEGRK